MMSSVLSTPIVSVLVQPIKDVLTELLQFCDDASIPILHALEQGGMANPNLKKSLELSVHCFERPTGLQLVEGSISDKDMSPVHPDALLCALLALSGENESVTNLRREMMGCGKTLICLPTTPVSGTGPVHVVVSQNPCEHKRGQRPWSIRYVVAQQIIVAQYGVVVTSRA